MGRVGPGWGARSPGELGAGRCTRGGHRIPQRPWLGASLLCAVLPLLFACFSGPAAVALEGDLPALKKSLDEARSRGGLGREEAQQLARAVLQRELVALDSDSAWVRFAAVAPCARQIEPLLESLASSPGPRGVLAAWTLQDRLAAGVGSSGLVGDLVGSDRAALRRGRMEALDEHVRLAAVLAARASTDPGDVPFLRQAARLDPNHYVRLAAVAALGGIGGEAAERALLDLWDTGDGALRQAVIEAWAHAPTYRGGGRLRLLAVAERDPGPLGVLAATKLVRLDGTGLQPVATAILRDRIERGSGLSQRLAVRLTPGSEWADMLPSLHAAARSQDAATAVVALARLSQQGEQSKEEVQLLLELSKSEEEIVSLVARVTLATLGDETARKSLEKDLAAPAAQRRLVAALAVARAQGIEATVDQLADDSPEVRTALACELIRAGDPVAFNRADPLGYLVTLPEEP